MCVQAGICTATELAVPQHVNIHTDPVFNKTVLELAAHPQARYAAGKLGVFLEDKLFKSFEIF